MGWMMGVEPTTFRATIWRANQLCYIHHILFLCAELPAKLARQEGLEPPTYCLEEKLQTPAKMIYYKFEDNNTSGSHKLNSAIDQAY